MRQRFPLSGSEGGWEGVIDPASRAAGTHGSHLLAYVENVESPERCRFARTLRRTGTVPAISAAATATGNEQPYE